MRVNIGFARNCGRVAKGRGHPFQQSFQRDALFARLDDRRIGDDARAPGAKMLGREVASGCLADIGVDVAGRDWMPRTIFIHELKQRLPRKRSEEHTSELQSLMTISYAVFCLKKKHYKT